MATTLRSLLLASMSVVAACVLAQGPPACRALGIADDLAPFPAVHGPSLLPSGLPPLDHVRIRSPYSYEQLGIFCKAEVKMNKLFGVPVMIRLGNVERVQELEGKGIYRHLH